MPNYKNISKLYKVININGVRTPIPPNGVFYSDKEIDLKIFDFFQITNDKTNVKESVKKLPVVKDDVDNLINNIKSMIITKDEIKQIIEQDYQKTVMEKLSLVEKRQGIIKNAIDEINKSLLALEDYVYNNEQYVIEDANKSSNISIMDIINEQKGI
jgi:hypothetical protein